MQIWSAEIKELEKLYVSLKGLLPDLEKELEQLIETKDANVVMLYSRRCLEIIVSVLCESELKRPRGTEPLQGIIDKLHKEKKIPSHIIASMRGLNELSTFGTHPKDFDPEQVKPVLSNLTIIIKWYLKFKDAGVISKPTPEEVKDETKGPEDSTEKIQKSKKRLILIFSGLLLVVAIVIISLFVFNVIGGKKESKELEKSIAVLPFKNDSPDQERMYFINGTMEAILDNLCKIKDLRVPGRTSVEQYRNNPKPIPAIAKELNVSYILEGSGHRDGDNVRLFVQLLDGKKDQHLWSKTYDANIEDIFSMQSEIAQLIANELKVIITPEEKQIIEKTSTTSLTAYDLYLEANEYQKEYSQTRNLRSYHTAVNLYMTSIEIDTTFAKAYTGLARSYYDRYYWPEFFTEDFLDSCLVLANIALSIDDKLDEAYYLKGLYYQQNGDLEEALRNYDRTIKINPNFYSVYMQEGYLYTRVLSDNVKGLENYHKALTLVSGDERPSLLRTIGNTYADLGFFEKAKYYFQEALALDNNQVVNLIHLGWMEFSRGNYDESLRLSQEAYQMDTTRLFNLHFYLYASGHHEEEAYAHAQKVIERSNRTGVPEYYQTHRIGYIYYKMGKIEEAEDYFKQQIKYCEESIKLNRFYSQQKHAHYDLSAIYAFLGDKEKAYQNLDELNTMNYFELRLISWVKNDPLYASIRNEERFQKILQDMEAKHQAEYERVRKWLEEQGML